MLQNTLLAVAASLLTYAKQPPPAAHPPVKVTNIYQPGQYQGYRRKGHPMQLNNRHVYEYDHGRYPREPPNKKSTNEQATSLHTSSVADDVETLNAVCQPSRAVISSKQTTSTAQPPRAGASDIQANVSPTPNQPSKAHTPFTQPAEAEEDIGTKTHNLPTPVSHAR